MEEALALLAERDAKLDALADFVTRAKDEWGEPTAGDSATAAELPPSSSCSRQLVS